MNNNNNNNQSQKSFVDSFNAIQMNLRGRYAINMHLDFINEFIKFADNTRDISLIDSILNVISDTQNTILNLIKDYENERNNKENID